MSETTPEVMTARRGSGTNVATVEEIRAHFPALARRHGGHPVAYFDGPGGTQVPQVVVDAMAEYLLRHNANTHWLYPTSEETDALLLRAREALADFVNAGADEISFGANMTTITFHLARGLARGWKPGDEIVVTELDHHANVAPWVAAARDFGLTIRTVRMQPSDGRLVWDDLDRLIGPRTKLLAIGAASNALGTITDIRSAIEMAHAVGALAFVDAVHYAAHEPVDVQALGCEFLACSAYKFYGPHVAVLFASRAIAERIDVPKLVPAPNSTPERFETGTQNHEGIVGAAAAVDFLASLTREPMSRRLAIESTFATLHRRGAALLARLWDELAAIDGVTLYGPAPGTPRTPTLAFTMRGRSTNEIAIALAQRGLFVSNGDFYAMTVIERLGQAADGVVRVGCSCYTAMEEIERLLDAVRSLAAST